MSTEYRVETSTFCWGGCEREQAAMALALAMADGAAEVRLTVFREGRPPVVRTIRSNGHRRRQACRFRQGAMNFLGQLQVKGRAVCR